MLLINSSYPAFVEDDLLDFLEDQGLQELSAGFVSEEIEVGHLPSMPDNLLVQLGVKTMGSRLNLRTAATAWLIEERSQVQDSEREQVRPFSDIGNLQAETHLCFRWMSKEMMAILEM